MTNKEAINILVNAYEYYAEKGGRGCGKTALRIAMLMGANAINLIEKLGLRVGQEIDGVYLTKEEHEKLFEYKHMYEDLCK